MSNILPLSSEHSASSEPFSGNKQRIARTSRSFFGTWGLNHSESLASAGYLEAHPAQELDYHKSSSMMPDAEKSAADIAEMIEGMLAMSFSDQQRARDFINAPHQAYSFEGGNGRTFLQVAIEDFLVRGKSIAALMWHPDDGLTDIPRFTGIQKAAIAREYGADYMSNVGEIASKTLTYETYLGVPVPDLLSLVGNSYFVGPQTKSAEAIRQAAGISKEEFDEMYTYINSGAGRVLLEDIRRPQDSRGHIIAVSPSGTRAHKQTDNKGQVEQLTTDPVTPTSARLLGHVHAYWPVGIINECIQFGPIIPLVELPKGTPKEKRTTHSLQQLEDAMELTGQQLDMIIGKRVSFYPRTTQRGEMYRSNTLYGETARLAGRQASRSTTSLENYQE